MPFKFNNNKKKLSYEFPKSSITVGVSHTHCWPSPRKSLDHQVLPVPYTLQATPSFAIHRRKNSRGGQTVGKNREKEIKRATVKIYLLYKGSI